MKYNEEHGITPTQIKRARSSALNKEYTSTAEARAYVEPDYSSLAAEPLTEYTTRDDLKAKIEQTRQAMRAAAKKLEFLEAAQLRDRLIMLEEMLK